MNKPSPKVIPIKHQRFLLHAVGSHGDVLPIIELAKSLRSCGHDAHLFVHAFFAPRIRDAGLKVTALGSLNAQEKLIRHADIVHERRAHRVLAHLIKETTPIAYHAMADALRAGPAIVIGNTTAFACQLLKETHAVPCVTIHYSPSVMRSNSEPPRLSKYRISAPATVYPALWWALDRWFVDPLYAVPLNRQRQSLGLPPIKRVIHNWIHGSDLVLGMFPSWFAKPPSDWPTNLRLTGFQLTPDRVSTGLPEPVAEFLNRGDAPIGFTPGTHTATAAEFFQTSAEVCRQMGRRGIFLTRFADQLPRNLPPTIAHFDYVPFEALLPKLAAFVHHGGIGTTSQAFLAGVPQLIRPMSFDQFDNSSRACLLGVATEILAHRYSPQNAASALAELIDTSNIARNCANLAQRASITDGIKNACEAILNAPFCHNNHASDIAVEEIAAKTSK